MTKTGGDEMKTIWKFPIELADKQSKIMPAGLKFLDVQFQHGSICLWAIVDDEVEMMARTIVIVGTGHAFPESLESSYIGTVQDQGFVWHVFDGGIVK